MQNGWYIASIVLGSIIVVLAFLVFVIPHRKVNLLLRLSFDIINLCNCVCIYFATNTTAMLISVSCSGISIIRDIVFYYRKKGNIIDKIYWPIGFNILFALSLIWTWAGPISLLPAIGNIINTSALYIYKKKVTRIVTLFGEVFFITYCALLLQSSGLLTLFSLLSSVAYFAGSVCGLIVIYVRDKKRNKQEPNNEIASE